MFVELDRQLKAVTANPELVLQKPARWAARNLALPPVFETGFQMLEYKNLERLDQLDGLVDDNTLLIVVLRHGSHSDILAGITLAQKIRSSIPNIDDFYFPVAKSLVDGLQGFFPQLLYGEGTVPLLEKANLTSLPVVTDNDKDKRGMNPTGADIRRIMRAAAKPNSAILDLAEGSVEGGRYDVLGHIRGIQRVTNRFLPIALRVAFEKGKRVVILPVGISGTNRMLSAESLFLTWRGVGALLEDKILGEPPTLATVTIGNPYEFPNPGFDLLEHTQAVNDPIMYRVAELVPIWERGYYHPLTREYQAEIKRFEQKFVEDHGRLQLDLLKLGLIPFPQELTQIAEKFPKEVEEELPKVA